MNLSARGHRSRWVGPPVPTPKSKLRRSPFGRQRHYGAVELAGAGEQVNVNDVVEIMDNKQAQETAQQHTSLVQVLSMWEDTFTGVFKFRARWLVQASDLPADTLPRLQKSRQASVDDYSATGSKTSSNKDQHESDEVFLTERVRDLEVRAIVKPITLCVSTSTTTAVYPGWKGKMGPRLTHAFSDKSGNFSPLEGADPILKRARVRQANAVALASRADQEREAAKSGKPIPKSNGWLLPKRGAYQRMCGAGLGIDIVKPSLNKAERPISPPGMDIAMSDDSGTEEPPNSEDGEWNEGEDDDDDAMDPDSSKISRANLSVSESFKPRKSSRQRKSQQPPGSDAVLADISEVKESRKGQADHLSKEQVKEYSEPIMEESSNAKVEVCSEAKLVNSTKAKVGDISESQVDDCSESTVEECCQANVCSSPSTSAPLFQRRRRASSSKRRGPLSARPRRLAMPPMTESPLTSQLSEAPPLAIAKSSVQVKLVRPVRTRMSMGLRPKSTPALPLIASTEDTGKASAQLSTPAKRKRSGAAKTTQAARRSDYPLLRTPVGKEYQADIDDLLTVDERKQPRNGPGAKMVWRSIQDWDPQSRGMLAGYLHAAKGVVEAKQARPGVAVHVRLGGEKNNTRGDKEGSTDIAGSYAVWAISSGRAACGLVRVACSEMAQTDIPKSAIQRVQSEEQALSALVKARCVLDDFEPALQMLNNDQGSPESIEPWALKQVRALEKALADDYEPKRRLHGWARPGMDMDREDFIDLATVSKQVPGKTPTQVLSFYYKYLAAAEPLTDVVYGPEAAKARKQEKHSSVYEAEAVLLSDDSSTQGNAHTAKPQPPVKQASPALRGTSPANTSADVPKVAPKPAPLVVRLSAPKQAQSVLEKNPKKGGTAIDSVSNDDMSTNRDHFASVKHPVSPASEASSTPHSLTVPKNTITEVTSGSDDRTPKSNRATDQEAKMQGEEDVSLGGASVYFAQQRRCAVKDREASRTLPRVPPVAEMLEVKDSHDADERGATHKAAPPIFAGGDRARPPDIEVAARYSSSVEPAGLSCVSRNLSRQAVPAIPSEPRRSEVPPKRKRSAAHYVDNVGEYRTGVSGDAPCGYYNGAPGVRNTHREPRWIQPPPTPASRHEAPLSSCKYRPSNGQVESRDTQRSGVNGLGYNGRGSVHLGPEAASTDDMFGSMAPCWRLLERARAYMDKDQLEYMRGLILTHVRRPMSRDQLLERAESCLQEQDRIFAAFLKMFDCIDQPPQVPLYPGKRALRHCPRSTPSSVRPSPGAGPAHGSYHGVAPPEISTPRTVNAQERRLYSQRPVHDGGLSQVYTRAPAPASDRVEIRLSIHPYDHDGSGASQASDVGNHGISGTVGIRTESSPYYQSPGRHHSDIRVNLARYADGRFDTGPVGEARLRKSWSQQPPGEWKAETGSSAVAKAAVPCSTTKKGSRGPTWRGGMGGTWS